MLEKNVFWLALLLAVAFTLLCSISSCSSWSHDYQAQLIEADSLLNKHPAAALDSLLSIDPQVLCKADNAYYNLLLTIAYHKNYLSFQGDSSIASALKWFVKSGKSPRNTARAYLYNGLVLNARSYLDTVAYQYMRASLCILEENNIQDERLKALAYAYLARTNDINNNLQEAVTYYRKAVVAEARLDNVRNLIINQCNLLTCLVKMGSVTEAGSVLKSLDSTLAFHPEIQIESTDNAKAIYYLNSAKDLDSALFYCQKWNVHPADAGAKENMMAVIYRQKGQYDNAILWEKASFVHARLEDSLSRHVYFRHLAEDYNQLGNADSSAHYARLAYQALYDQQAHRTEKRILELEKQFDIASKEAELETTRHRQNLLTVIILALSFLIAGLFMLVRSRNKKLRAEQFTRSIVQASAKTHQNTLSLLKPLCIRRKSNTVEDLQSKLAVITTDLRKGFTHNFSDAIEKNRHALTPRQQDMLQMLSGERAKTVFILSELGYSEEEIAEYTCTSADSVRVTKNNNRKAIDAIMFG